MVARGLQKDTPSCPHRPSSTFAATRISSGWAGADAVARLVDAFYAAMDTRADAREVRAMHEPDLGPTKAVLKTYLAEWLGGPKRYTETRGAPRLRRVHGPFPIDGQARQAWLACMRQALEQTCEDPALREELLAAFMKIANHLQNTPDSPQRSP